MNLTSNNVVYFNAWKEKSIKNKTVWSADVSNSSIHVHHEPTGASFYFSRDGQTSFLLDYTSTQNSDDDPEIFGDYLNEASEIAEQIATEEWTA